MSFINNDNPYNQANCHDFSRDVTQKLTKSNFNCCICETSNHKTKYCHNLRCKKCQSSQQNDPKCVLHEKLKTVTSSSKCHEYTLHRQ